MGLISIREKTKNGQFFLSTLERTVKSGFSGDSVKVSQSVEKQHLKTAGN